MKDVRNIVIGLLAVGLVWGWANGQQRRQRGNPGPANDHHTGAAPGLVGTYQIAAASANHAGDSSLAYRLNTSTGEIDVLTYQLGPDRVHRMAWVRPLIVPPN